MTTFQDVYAQIEKILLDFDVSIRCSDLFERLLQVYAYKLNSTELWGNKDYSLTFNPVDREKDRVGFVINNDEAHVKEFYEFLKEKCDADAVLGDVTVDGKKYPTVLVNTQKCYEKLVPFFQQLMNSLKANNVPELKPHMYASGYDPYILRKRYQARNGMNKENNPFGQMMREFSLNLTNLFISPYYTHALGYSLLKMVGESNSTFEEKPIEVVGIDMTGIHPGDVRYVDNGWGFISYFGFDTSERIDINPSEDGSQIKINVAFEHGRPIEKIKELLKKYCNVKFANHGVVSGMGNTLYQAEYTIQGKDFYENFVPIMREHFLSLAKDPLPFLYEKYVANSVQDPDVILAKSKGPAATTWTSLDVKFPEAKVEKKKADAKKKDKHSDGCCTFFKNILHKIDPRHQEADKYMLRR